MSRFVSGVKDHLQFVTEDLVRNLWSCFRVDHPLAVQPAWDLETLGFGRPRYEGEEVIHVVEVVSPIGKRMVCAMVMVQSC